MEYINKKIENFRLKNLRKIKQQMKVHQQMQILQPQQTKHQQYNLSKHLH